MTAIRPQYITDTAGKKMVVISLQEFDELMESVEELDDIKLYDEAKRTDNGERILFTDYLEKRSLKNGG